MTVSAVLAAEAIEAADTTRIRPLADEYVAVFESPDPLQIFCNSPGLARCPNGRLVTTLDLSGPGVPDLPGPKGRNPKEGKINQGRIFTSDDRGKTWIQRAFFPFMHARPFVAGKSLYVLGHMGHLMIMRSDDQGLTWSKPTRLTDGGGWHQAPSNVHHARGNIYLVMEKKIYSDVAAWPVSILAPVLMRARVDQDLTRREAWTFASELAFRDAVPDDIDYFGVPFFRTHRHRGYFPAPKRPMAPTGWLEANVVQFVDPDHYWHDPTGHTFHLWMRAHTGGTGYAAIARVVEDDKGAMTTMLETMPSGKKCVYVPCPGGQIKFHILYDEDTRRYWLLSSQATDSMTRADRLPAERFELPNNERHRLQLHFSRNCIDWCFAGMVAIGPAVNQSRHYASMVIDGNDLHILSRTGDHRASSAHNCNIISFHTIKNFRRLVY